MIRLFFFSVFICIAYCFGRRVLRLLGFAPLNHYESPVISLGLSFGIVAYTVLCLGWAGLLYSWVSYVVLLVLFALSIGELRNLAFMAWSRRKDKHLFSVSKTGAFLLVVLGIHILLNLVGSLAPITSKDALHYHLAVPDLYVEHHKIVEVPYEWHSYQPFTVQMLYVFALLFYDDIFAALINFLFSVLLALSIYAFCKEYKLEKIALLSAIIFYANPLMNWESTSCYIDLGLAWFGFLSVHCICRWLERQQMQWLILSAVFAGLCAGSKMSGVIFPVLIAMVFFWGKGKRWKLRFRELLFFVTVSGVIACPWDLQNLIRSGNPVFPFLYDLFGGTNWNQGCVEVLRIVLHGRSVSQKISLFGASPFIVTFQEGRLLCSPLFLTFIPLLFLFFAENGTIKRLAILSGLFFGFWWFFLGGREFRWLMPIVPLCSVIVAYVMFRLLQAELKLKAVVLGSAWVYFLFSVGVGAVYNSKFFPVVLGLESKQEFLLEKVRNYDVKRFINEKLPNNSKILSFLRPCCYYIDREYVKALPRYSGLIDYSKIETPEQLLEKLKELGVTHIVKEGRFTMEDSGKGFVDKEEAKIYMTLYRGLEDKYLEVIYHKELPVFKKRTMPEKEIAEVYLYEVCYP
jgi:4-amino-4-deoxy-L-arabinose transferase-like glycosyltransferase